MDTELSLTNAQHIAVMLTALHAEKHLCCLVETERLCREQWPQLRWRVLFDKHHTQRLTVEEKAHAE